MKKEEEINKAKTIILLIILIIIGGLVLYGKNSPTYTKNKPPFFQKIN